MRSTLLLIFLLSSAVPALGINKCESGGKITYSDLPCIGGHASQLPIAEEAPTSAPVDRSARDQLARDKAELRRIEDERNRREIIEERERRATQRATLTSQKRCRDLALKKKWADEDAAVATLKSEEKSKRAARRRAEQFELACGKQP